MFIPCSCRSKKSDQDERIANILNYSHCYHKARFNHTIMKLFSSLIWEMHSTELYNKKKKQVTTVSLTKGWRILLSGGKYRLHSFPLQPTSHSVLVTTHRGIRLSKRNNTQGHWQLDNLLKRIFQLHIHKVFPYSSLMQKARMCTQRDIKATETRQTTDVYINLLVRKLLVS